jgi:hypothetical protein
MTMNKSLCKVMKRRKEWLAIMCSYCSYNKRCKDMEPLTISGIIRRRSCAGKNRKRTNK